MRGRAAGGNQVTFGEFGLQALGCSWIDSRQIEAARRAITPRPPRWQGGLHLLTSRSPPFAETAWEAVRARRSLGRRCQPGRMLFELSGVRLEDAQEAMRLAAHKLPIQTRFVVREHEEV
jgi:large subunit ribosomal protein L16